MGSWKDINVRVWGPETVDIDCPEHFQYVSGKSYEGLQCNFEENGPEYEALRSKLCQISSLFSEVDSIISTINY